MYLVKVKSNYQIEDSVWSVQQYIVDIPEDKIHKYLSHLGEVISVDRVESQNISDPLNTSTSSDNLNTSDKPKRLQLLEDMADK